MHVLARNGTVVKYPYSFRALREDNPQVSFPKNPPDALLAQYDVFRVTQTDRPAYDASTQDVVESSPEYIGDIWTQVWAILPVSAEVVEERAEQRAVSVRAARDQWLQETDWVVVRATETGASIPSEWATYRQALRDVTVHPNFPYLLDDDWPVKPD